MKTTHNALDPETAVPSHSIQPTPDQVNVMGDFLKVMGDPGRLGLLLALQDHERCPSVLADMTNNSRSAVSHQLRVLKAAKLVKSRKEGKTIYYSLDDDHVRSILQVVFDHIQEGQPK